MQRKYSWILLAAAVLAALALAFFWPTTAPDAPPDVPTESAPATSAPDGVPPTTAAPDQPAATAPVTTTAPAEPTTEPPATTAPTEAATEPPATTAPTTEPEVTTAPAQAGDTPTCTLSVRCDTLLEAENAERLDPDKRELVPADGAIFPETAVTFTAGESAYQVLARELRRAKIHLEVSRTPAYQSVYIEGIGNLYAFDCGEQSGWIYQVNGQSPMCSSSEYLLQPGDSVAFIYTCQLGDIGSWTTN